MLDKNVKKRGCITQMVELNCQCLQQVKSQNGTRDKSLGLSMVESWI